MCFAGWHRRRVCIGGGRRSHSTERAAGADIPRVAGHYYRQITGPFIWTTAADTITGRGAESALTAGRG